VNGGWARCSSTRTGRRRFGRPVGAVCSRRPTAADTGGSSGRRSVGIGSSLPPRSTRDIRAPSTRPGVPTTPDRGSTGRPTGASAGSGSRPRGRDRRSPRSRSTQIRPGPSSQPTRTTPASTRARTAGRAGASSRCRCEPSTVSGSCPVAVGRSTRPRRAETCSRARTPARRGRRQDRAPDSATSRSPSIRRTRTRSTAPETASSRAPTGAGVGGRRAPDWSTPGSARSCSPGEARRPCTRGRTAESSRPTTVGGRGSSRRARRLQTHGWRRSR